MYTILHLETSNFYRTLIKEICDELSIDYFPASGSIDALSILQSQKVDLIITAMELESGPAKEFLLKLNSSDFKSIPVVVITGNDSFKDRKMMFDLGIVDYISKKSTAPEIKRSLMLYKSQNPYLKKIVNLSIAACDDSLLDRNIMHRIFTMNGITSVDYYSSGSELLESNRKYDIYLVDIILKDISGKKIIQKLRETDNESIIIAISGINHFKTISNVLNIGANDYITKPFNNDLFMARIQTSARNYLLMRELKLTNELLKNKAVTDGLTSLYNHNFIIEQLDTEVHKCKRYEHQLSIIMLDIDHFKKLNDTYGHQFGDVVLKKVAMIIQKNIREVDVAGRYGGEEFLVLLPETDAEGAFVVAERIRRDVEQLRSNKADFKVTISGGVQEFRGQSSSELIEEADSFLYRAKSAGRNVIISDKKTSL